MRFPKRGRVSYQSSFFLSATVVSFLFAVVHPQGLVATPVLMSLADTAGALVTFLGLPEGAGTATITSTSQLFRPVSSGMVRAVAVPLHRGRTTVTAQSNLYDDAQRLVAQVTQIQAVRFPR